MTTATLEHAVVDRIDELGDELMRLTAGLASAYCPPGREHAAADVARDWLSRNGMTHESYGAVPARPSVVAVMRGADAARHASLLFNSHLDSPISREEDHLRLRNPLDRKYTTSWIDGDRVYGYGAVNDKGPMAAWMIAAKALAQAAPGALGGDLLLTMVSGEIGQAPMDEYQGVRYEGTGYGARQLVDAGVRADYVVVAETTGFTAAWLELGKANYKITLRAGPSRYTPHIPRPVELDDNPNAIVRCAPLLLALEAWAAEYQRRTTTSYDGGEVIPKVNIGAIRSGVPYNLERVPEVCFVYLDVRTLPDADPEAIRAELARLLAAQGLDGRVELTSYHAGAVSPDPAELLGALRAAHRAQFGRDMERAAPVMSSMWRDTIPFARVGIPSLTYGPALPTGGRDEYFMERSELLAAAKVYARLALDLCNRPRPA